MIPWVDGERHIYLPESQRTQGLVRLNEYYEGSRVVYWFVFYVSPFDTRANDGRRFDTPEEARAAANQHVADLYLRGELDALTAGP